MAITIVPQLSDNFSYLISDDASRECAVVDCAEADKVINAVTRQNLKLVAVLTTHWHPDHSGGNADIVGKVRGLRVIGATAENGRIPALTNPVADGDTFKIGELEARVIGIPAHTNGHVAYYFPQLKSVFTGDTLFVAGCGRVFEGKAATMVDSLAKLAKLPEDTKVYCGHEYTEKNLRFAMTLEPNNQRIKTKHEWAQKTVADGGFTVPSTIEDEKRTNPFLRTDSIELITNVRRHDPQIGGDPISIFAKARELKDRF
jgi:hydroxyacylglutathione hydrolase